MSQLKYLRDNYEGSFVMHNQTKLTIASIEHRSGNYVFLTNGRSYVVRPDEVEKFLLENRIPKVDEIEVVEVSSKPKTDGKVHDAVVEKKVETVAVVRSKEFESLDRIQDVLLAAFNDLEQDASDDKIKRAEALSRTSDAFIRVQMMKTKFI